MRDILKLEYFGCRSKRLFTVEHVTWQSLQFAVSAPASLGGYVRSTNQAGSQGSAPVPAYLHDHDTPAGLFTRLQRAVILMEMLQEEAVADVDITFRDFVILATLRREPEPHELPVTVLAEYVLRPMGSITHAVDRVERRGLVERRPVPTDRRKVIVALTPEGRRKADEVFSTYDDIRTRLFKRLSAEFEQLDDAIHLLLGALETDHWESNND